MWTAEAEMYSRILVPLDGSQLAEAVLPHVERIAMAWGSTVLLLHIIERSAPDAVHGDRHLRAVTEAEEYLARLCRRFEEQGIAVESHAHDVPEGDVARAIVEHQEEDRADLIAMCTHGQGNLHSLLFGRIAQQVLRRGTIPVLLVRPELEPHHSGFEHGIVLVPLDESAHMEAGLQAAEEIARRLDVPLHLLMVVPTSGTIRGDRQAIATLLPAATRFALEMEREGAETYLEDLAVPLRAQGLTVTTEITRGDVVDMVTESAQRPDIGLVILPTHARAGLPAMWGRSIATRLLEHTHVPLLLVRRDDR
jgi:nucleotide-binding universal stress UspA family protein